MNVVMTGDLTAWLQSVPGGGVNLSPAACTLLADAVEIADSCARSDIECNCATLQIDSRRWYDTVDNGGEYEEWMPQVLRYLEARGLMERHASKPHLVAFKDP